MGQSTCMSCLWVIRSRSCLWHPAERIRHGKSALAPAGAAVVCSIFGVMCGGAEGYTYDCVSCHRHVITCTFGRTIAAGQQVSCWLIPCLQSLWAMRNASRYHAAVLLEVRDMPDRSTVGLHHGTMQKLPSQGLLAFKVSIHRQRGHHQTPGAGSNTGLCFCSGAQDIGLMPYKRVSWPWITCKVSINKSMEGVSCKAAPPGIVVRCGDYYTYPATTPGRSSAYHKRWCVHYATAWGSNTFARQ